MCGIAGFSGRFESDLLGRMNDRMAHRGPDDSGTLFVDDAGVGLAHRRLSIIDLSARGHQPMWDADQRAVIVYNGELYNFRELREELLADGFRFESGSDTEVLLNLYLRDGVGMLERLNGMFAFAIWDKEEKRLFVARDQIGVKPLYYTTTERGFLFASELKSLLAEPSVDRTIDPVAVSEHLLYLWCPSPRTMLKSVNKLKPGHAMIIRDGRIERTWQYYELPYDGEQIEISDEDAVAAVRSQLRKSVRDQLVSDVPIGSFLSGGLDSSAVVALAREAEPDLPLQCFTIGFSADDAHFEGMGLDQPYARRVAKELGVDLHTINVGPEMVNELETMIYHLDEPQADPAPINTLFICRLAREHGIKVLLSGTGGDDIFTGYRRHYALRQERYWRWMGHPVRNQLRNLSNQIQPTTELRRRVAKAFRFADREGDERIASYFYWIDPEHLESTFSSRLAWSLFAGDQPNSLVSALGKLPEETSELSRMLFLDGKYFLTDHNLNYTDKIAMATGVEVRVPLLDPDLIALAASLPDDIKQRGSVGKWVLRKAMADYLPKEVIYRPKAGFGAPLRHWLRHDLRPVIDDVLSPAALAKRGLFDGQGVRDLIEMDRRGEVDAAYPLFGMMCIELWCRMFLDSTAPPQVTASAA